MNEWWYFDFLRLTVMNCNELYFDVHYIVIEYLLLFVFVSISILTLLQNYRNLGFSFNPCLSKKMYIEKELERPMVALKSSLEDDPHGVTSQRVEVKTFAFTHMITWHANVAREVLFVSVMFLFTLEKTGKRVYIRS